MHKLLQINATANWGSTGKITEQIGIVAQSCGWESYIAYGRYVNSSQNHIVKVGSQFDVCEHYIENRLFDNEGLASCIPTKRLLKEIERIKPDVVHLHNIHDHWLNYKILFEYLAEKQIPVVWTQHDQWATTGHCCYNLVGCERWKTECHDCPLSKWYSLDKSRRNFNLKKNLCAKLKSLTIVSVSEWLADNIRESYLKDRPIEVIHNGIDLNVFKPQIADVRAKLGLGSKKIVLGVAAVWDARKGLKDFYALSRLLPSDEYEIVIVGKVDNKSKNSVKDGCKITFINHTQNVFELAQLYSAANVFVNPTYQDNYPTTNLEAMACGTPVATYRTGGSPEAVDENTGLVIEQGDVEALKDAVVEISGKDMRKACRKRAEAIFDKETCFNGYLSLYTRLLGGGKFIVLGVSSIWNNAKGLADFIKLSENDEFQVVLVGVNDEIKKRLPDNIIAISRTQDQQELAMLYSMADVFVNPTYADMFPTVNLEALACGTPVITYKTGGSPEPVGGKTSNKSGKVIEMYETGAVVENGNIEALAATIREFHDTDFKKHHSDDCRRRAGECFDKDKCFEQYIRLYESLLDR